MEQDKEEDIKSAWHELIAAIKNKQNTIENPEAIISTILEKYPGLCQKNMSSYGNVTLPLHVALYSDAPHAVLKALVECYPQALEVHGGHNGLFGDEAKTPLQLACGMEGCDMNKVNLLMNQKVIRTPDSEGMLPIHDYCCSEANEAGINVDVLEALIDAYPESVKQADNNGSTPLHLLCSFAREQHLPVVRHLMERYPGTTNRTDNNGFTLLHAACYNGGCLSCIQYLVESAPDMISTQDYKGDVPLHVVHCHNSKRNKLPLVKCLVEACPESLRARNHRGETPVHTACSRVGRNPGVLAFLTERYPAILEQDGINPISPPQHLLFDGLGPYTYCVEEFREETVQCLKASIASERAVSAKDCRGQNLIHLACSGCLPMDLVSPLVDMAPNALLNKDAHGRIPLHIAVSYRHPFLDVEEGRARIDKNVQLLLSKFPGGARVADNDGLTPVHIAAHNDNVPVSVLYKLVRSDPIQILGDALREDATTVANHAASKSPKRRRLA
jgi:ankyrin repeat protein